MAENDMSNREKRLWYTLMVDIIALVWFTWFIIETPMDAPHIGSYYLKTIAATILIIIGVTIALSFFFARPDDIEEMDERDELIHYRGYKIGFITFTALTLLPVGHYFLTGFMPDHILGKTDSLLTLNPLMIANVMLIVVTLASVAKDGATLYYYRRGM